jgi:hypothetical protein
MGLFIGDDREAGHFGSGSGRGGNCEHRELSFGVDGLMRQGSAVEGVGRIRDVVLLRRLLQQEITVANCRRFSFPSNGFA